jgi:transcriptional regulator with XRE-family HTH domain
MYDKKETPPALVGGQIRALRKSLGWSLSELARRAGTSAPSVHRYESGWDRFEMKTLRKIAAALGARLEVKLVKEETAQRMEETAPGKLVRILEGLFWDKKLTVKELEDYPEWVLSRVLMFGDFKQVGAARRYFGDKVLKGTLAMKGIDEKTRNYWKLMLGRGRHAS